MAKNPLLVKLYSCVFLSSANINFIQRSEKFRGGGHVEIYVSFLLLI